MSKLATIFQNHAEDIRDKLFYAGQIIGLFGGTAAAMPMGFQGIEGAGATVFFMAMGALLGGFGGLGIGHALTRGHTPLNKPQAAV